MAVTIDDLPVVGGGSEERRQFVTEGILSHLRRHRVPALGFVNERGLGQPAKSVRIDLLRRWLEEGHELGNHTYSHPSFFRTSLEAYLKEVDLGDEVIGPLGIEYKRPVRYFRHPYLNTGPDLPTKEKFEERLAHMGYQVAPVTIDNSEWEFARAYDKANGNEARRQNIIKAYLAYMNEMTEFFETYSQELFGREPKQILLIHANALNARCLNQLLDVYKKRGYEFVSLEQALKDKVYQEPDTYTGRRGISWIQRWAITRGKSFRKEPVVPDWIRQ